MEESIGALQNLAAHCEDDEAIGKLRPAFGRDSFGERGALQRGKLKCASTSTRVLSKGEPNYAMAERAVAVVEDNFRGSWHGLALWRIARALCCQRVLALRLCLQPALAFADTSNKMDSAMRTTRR
jgi:hypothetical protein